MQKIINIISCISFAAFLVGAGGLTYAFFNQEAIKEKILSEVTKSLPIPTDLLDFPSDTGPAIPLGENFFD